MGGGTTRVGDPSGKDESRKLISIEEIEANKRGISEVFSRVQEFAARERLRAAASSASDFEFSTNFENTLGLLVKPKFVFGSNASRRFVMPDNAEWLTKLNYIDMLRDIGRHFSINRMLTMDSVKLRLERQHELSFIEFNYMILQSYDFVELAKR
jgi:tyrosyl-tRNA synthetase